MPGAGGTQRLTGRSGSRWRWSLSYGRAMPATEAKAAGLVTKVVLPPRRWRRRWSSPTIAAMPPLAVRAAERSVLAAADLSLTEGLAAERAASSISATEDQREGMRAFMEKRPPTWTGR